MDELLIRVIVNLVRVQDELGDESFEHAAHRALVSIAQAVQIDAQRQAGMNEKKLGDGVIPFPSGGKHQRP